MVPPPPAQSPLLFEGHDRRTSGKSPRPSGHVGMHCGCIFKSSEQFSSPTARDFYASCSSGASSDSNKCKPKAMASSRCVSQFEHHRTRFRKKMISDKAMITIKDTRSQSGNCRKIGPKMLSLLGGAPTVKGGSGWHISFKVNFRRFLWAGQKLSVCSQDKSRRYRTCLQ